MVGLLLYAAQDNELLDYIIWAFLVVVLFASVVMLFTQFKAGQRLRYELTEFDKVKKSNVEYEFVLNAMRLSTWHIDPVTMIVTYDNDYRGQGNEWTPDVGGTGLKESAKQLHELDRPRVGQSIVDLCQGKKSKYHEEYRVMIGNTGKYYWEESYATVVGHDVEGRPTNIVGTSMRIDERKAMEEELIEARYRAEESDRLKTAFLANMSHEIRTPLNAIVGFTSVLPDVTEPEERQQLLDLVNENTQKLLRIVDDVVNISKVEAGKEEIMLTEFDLVLLLREVIDQFKGNVQSGVEIVTAFAAQTMMVTSDHNRVLEIARHLMSNATKFTIRGTIEVGFSEPHDGRIQIWVKDTGIGIAPEHLERVFERFFKVDEFVPGAGLGLSSCRTMAYSLGGSINLESVFGEGSTFTLQLPV